MGLNLGAGVDQHVNLTPLPQWVFQPTTGVSNTLRIFNEGSNPIYVGTAPVNPYNGFQIMPGAKPLELTNCNQTVYTCSAVTPGTQSCSLTTFIPAGSTVLTTSSPATNYPAGTYIIVASSVGTTTGAEVMKVAGTAATSITVSTATLYDHTTAATVTVANATYGQVRVTAGIV